MTSGARRKIKRYLDNIDVGVEDEPHIPDHQGLVPRLDWLSFNLFDPYNVTLLNVSAALHNSLPISGNSVIM